MYVCVGVFVLVFVRVVSLVDGFDVGSRLSIFEVSVAFIRGRLFIALRLYFSSRVYLRELLDSMNQLPVSDVHSVLSFTTLNIAKTAYVVQGRRNRRTLLRAVRLWNLFHEKNFEVGPGIV